MPVQPGVPGPQLFHTRHAGQNDGSEILSIPEMQSSFPSHGSGAGASMLPGSTSN